MSSDTASVTFVGSIFRDLVAVSRKFPRPGETVMGDQFFMGFGGKGANPAVMAAKLGAKVNMVGKVGDDEHGRSYMDNFKKVGVCVDSVEVVPESTTGIATILVESDTGENEIVIVQGANEYLQPQDVENVADIIKDSKVLSSVLEIKPETVLAALKLGKKHNVKTVLNAAPARPDLHPDILKNTDILIVNQTEAEIISGISGDWSLTAVRLLELGCGSVVVTLGKDGAVVLEKGAAEPVKIPTIKVEKVVDTTGAGDAFVGSLVYILSRGKSDLSLPEAVKSACAIASISVQAKGTQASYPEKDKVLHLLPSGI